MTESSQEQVQKERQQKGLTQQERQVLDRSMARHHRALEQLSKL